MKKEELSCDEISQLFKKLCELIKNGEKDSEDFFSIKELIENSTDIYIKMKDPLLAVDKKRYRDKFEQLFMSGGKNYFVNKFRIVNNITTTKNELKDIFSISKNYLKIYFIDVNSIDSNIQSELGLLFRFTDKKHLHSGNKYNTSDDIIYFLGSDNKLKELDSSLDLKRISDVFKEGLGKIMEAKTNNNITEWIGFSKFDTNKHSYPTDLYIELICICENGTDEYSQINDMKLSLAFQVDTTKDQFWDMGDLRP